MKLSNHFYCKFRERTTLHETIINHELEHVAFLTSSITALGRTPQKSPIFDFKAARTFPTVFSDYATLLLYHKH